MVFPLFPLFGLGLAWLGYHFYNSYRPRRRFPVIYPYYHSPPAFLYYEHPFTNRVVWVPTNQRTIYPKEDVFIKSNP